MPTNCGPSPVAGNPRLCAFCGGPIRNDARGATKWCGKACRQSAWRLRGRRSTELEATTRKRVVYADPPYPGMSRRFYKDHPDYGGEVDHPALIRSLVDGGYDGWALSTSARALRDLLPLVPPEARLCPWVKPHGVSSLTRGLHNAWEALIVMPARELRPGVRDFLYAMPARGGGDLMGRKPLAFCGFLFDALGMLPGDELVDLFPGTGIVSRAWASLQRLAPKLDRMNVDRLSLLQHADALLAEEAD